MTSLLFGIIISALLSTTSLLVVIFRVSPLLSPVEALPAFFLSLLLSISSLVTLGLYSLWRVVPYHTWDQGKLFGVAVRQGLLTGFCVITILFFHLLGLLSWWIGLLIVAVFLFIELAFDL